MRKKVENYIRTHNLINPHTTIVAGVSGGADSVCLLLILEELRDVLDFELVAVHVNHGVRGEAADRDEAYVTELCAGKQIPCEVYHVNMQEFARAEKLSEEEAGRRLRRQALEEVMEKYNGDRIALAHHQDDNAETLFLHLARGTRLRGLGGIYPVNGAYIRPLLCVGRQEIEEYLEKRGIHYCMDESNLEDTYTRNRIRNHVIPYLKEHVNPRTVEHVNGAMEQLREVQEYLERHADAAWQECVREMNGGIILDAAAFDRQESLMQGMVLRRMMVRLSGKEQDIEESHVNALKDLVKNQTGRAACLPYGMRAVRTYDGIELCRTEAEGGLQAPDPENEVQSLPLDPRHETTLEFGKWKITCRIFPYTGDAGAIPKKTYTKWFDYDIIEQSIHVRTRRAGDKIIIDEKGSAQKLKSFFINEKIPSPLRARIPLIAERDQILWAVGYRQSKAYQVTEHTTTILEININGGT